MQHTCLSIELGNISNSQNQDLSQLSIDSQCFFYFIGKVHSQSSETNLRKVILQLRGDYVLEIDVIQRKIVSGFKCDYFINFEIVRSKSNIPMKLGSPKSLQFIFKKQQNRRVSLIPCSISQFQQFISQLQKKYITQLGFHQNFKGVKILGKGLTATVYKGTRYRDHRQVAIKAFKRQSYFKKQSQKISFQKQFKILTSIEHDNVCQLYSVFQTQNTTYMVMEFLSLSLFGWIQKYGFPSYQQSKSIIYQILKGVQYLHQKGIMHRDLKLENIMVRKDSNYNIQIVIIDFGLAQYTNSEQLIYSRCGTPGYVAPQVISRDAECQNYSQLCDIFSLGVIFHILFFKRPVFQGNFQQILKKNIECNIKFTDSQLINFDQDGMQLLRKMLQKDPNLRITAKDALNHEFLRSCKSVQKTQKTQKMSKTLQSIKNID